VVVESEKPLRSKFSDSILPGTTAAKFWNAAALVLGQVACTVPLLEELVEDELLEELLLEELLEDELLLDELLDDELLAPTPPQPAIEADNRAIPTAKRVFCINIPPEHECGGDKVSRGVSHKIRI